MTSTKKLSKWQAGTSGNPQGRPVGAGELGRLRSSIAEHLPAIIDQLVSKALEGDSQAARLLLERVLPPLRPQEQPQPINLQGSTLTDQAHSIIACVANGEVSISQALQLLGAIGAIGKLVEQDAIVSKITENRLEKESTLPDSATDKELEELALRLGRPVKRKSDWMDELSFN